MTSAVDWAFKANLSIFPFPTLNASVVAVSGKAVGLPLLFHHSLHSPCPAPVRQQLQQLAGVFTWMHWLLRAARPTAMHRAYLTATALLIKTPRVCRWPGFVGKSSVETNPPRLSKGKLGVDEAGPERSSLLLEIHVHIA